MRTSCDIDVLVKEENLKPAIFDRVWEVSEEISPCHYVMPDEVFYCYTISHIRKHLKDGGCGVRPLIDLWVLNNKIGCDDKKREELLKKADDIMYQNKKQRAECR